jgi:cytochrome P450
VRDVELGIFETHFQALQAVLPRDGTTFDIQQLFGSFILDASTEVFLGASTGLLSSQKTHNTEGQKFADAFDYAQRVVIGMDNLSISSLLRKLVFGDQRHHDSLAFVDQFIYKMLDNALYQRDESAAQGHGYQAHNESLLSTLVAEGRSKSEIKCDIVNVILATRDTTTAYISSIWYLLSKHPDVYNKVLAEISVLDGRPPTKEDLHRFTYLQMVLQEGTHDGVSRHLNLPK